MPVYIRAGKRWGVGLPWWLWIWLFPFWVIYAMVIFGWDILVFAWFALVWTVKLFVWLYHTAADAWRDIRS